MFERVTSSVIVAAAAAAAAVLTVFAAGFALYAWIQPYVGVPGAAAIVALVSALGAAVFALVAANRARQRELEAERAAAAAQTGLLGALPPEFAEFARDRPIISLGVTLLGGLLAARHPTLIRDVISIFARR